MWRATEHLSEISPIAKDIDKIKSIIDGYEIYLSNSELKAVAQKLGKLPPIDVLNILIENAPLQEEVRATLQDHLNTLPVFVKNFLTKQYSSQFDQLLNQVTGLSLRAEIELDIIRYIKAQPVIWQNPLEDNGGGGIDCRNGMNIKQYALQSLQTLSKSTVENKPWFKKQEIEYLMEIGEYKQANQTLESLQSSIEEDVADYVYLKQLEIRLKQESRGIKDLTKAELIQLEDIKNNNTVEGILARNTLIIHNEGSLDLKVPPIPVENLKEDRPVIEGNDNWINTLDVWPNPSNYEINIDLSATFNVSSQLQIVLFDHTGKQLKELKLPYQEQLKMSIDDIEEGTYILSVIDVVTGNHNKAKILIIR